MEMRRYPAGTDPVCIHAAQIPHNWECFSDISLKMTKVWVRSLPKLRDHPLVSPLPNWITVWSHTMVSKLSLSSVKSLTSCLIWLECLLKKEKEKTKTTKQICNLPNCDHFKIWNTGNINFITYTHMHLCMYNIHTYRHVDMNPLKCF